MQTGMSAERAQWLLAQYERVSVKYMDEKFVWRIVLLEDVYALIQYSSH